MRKAISSLAGRFLCGGALCLVAAAATVAIDDDAWTRAIGQRDMAALERMVARGADVNRPNAAGYTALMIAAAERDHPLVRDLVAHGADVNVANPRGGTALMYAAAVGDLESVRFLLSRKAGVDARAANGWTALTLASARGFEAVALALLANGADPNAADIYGWTPLMRAVDLDRPAIVRVLLTSPRTNMDAVNENGRTALHHAALRGSRTLVRLLIARGAHTAVRDYGGHTPAALAKLQGHRGVAEIIERAGAR